MVAFPKVLMKMIIHFRIIAVIAAWCYFYVLQLTNGQAPPLKNTLVQDLANTFGFCYGQRLTLTQLRQMFPDLETQIMLAEMQWNSAFKEAEVGVEERLKAFGPDQWEINRAKMIAQFEPILKQQNGKATHELAVNVLEVVQQRAKGVLDSPHREMLLASHPRFVKSPQLEFSMGYTGTFSSKGHSKAKGVDLTVRYPLSWKQFEADRPNIVQKWTSDGGHGNDIFMVQIRKLPAVPTPQESAELFTGAFANQMFEGGGKVLSYTTGRLEKLPLGIVHFTQTTKRLDVSVDTRGVFYYLIHGDAFISLQFLCYTPGGAEAKDARIKQLDPLIRLIVNSLVLPSNYK
jgi:hypothetical protein